ncbi:phosphotransferase [Paenibacillus sp. LMG 31456]|uniref:Phosphotransferase n=1 Tax=Paenibacillus foliorum TaxID=2654974 RepID=A0A972GU72_9BACL|nr:phosphotransferase [Paenibacillus foliorum]NOU96777.1 phosphotransferase [Paenibacillus foliorum]
MEQQVERLFGESVLREAAERFGLNQEYFKKLGDFENYVYEMHNQQGEAVIMRLTHSSHRSESRIAAELDWIYFLINEGLDIPRCYESLLGKRVEKLLVEDSYFTAALFQKAEGNRVDFHNPAEWNQQLFREWGRLTGQMHHATSSYRVTADPDDEGKRQEWYEDELLLEARKYVSEDEEFILESLEEILKHLHGLPQDNRSYGLIHSDMHQGNFFVANGRISVFDFDDCAYNWFIHDIAIPLYYSVSWAIPDAYNGDRDAFAAEFFEAFWTGYQVEHKLDAAWLQELPYFLRLRDLTLYLVINKKVEPHARDSRMTKWMEEIKSRLKQNIPIVGLDCLKINKLP